MLELQQQQLLGRILGFGLFLVSVVILMGSTTDPVNVPKFLALGVFSFVAFGITLSFKINILKFGDLKIKIALAIFLSSSIFAVLSSKSPFSQNIYGVYGRNNGFLTYMFLSLLLFVATLVTNRLNQFKILKALMLAGLVNVAYCLWVIIFGDFIPWSNPYGNVLGTFGNPNFIGAFLGIFFGVLFALGLGQDLSRNFKFSLLLILPLTLFVIIDSSAIQGRVLAALSIGIVGIFYLYFKFSNKVAYLFTFVCMIFGSLALLGAFQRGPLVDLIYKTSVSLRGQYWLAAWNTGMDNPISGVGMDAFGDWYRRSRDVRAIELPGINTVVNTAHNVPLDMFAFGGWPLFIAYLLIMILALKSLLIIVKNMKKYDGVGVALITAWVCYQTQSIISINQIGLAIWGWVLSGSLIAYAKSVPTSDLESSKSSKLPRKNGPRPAALKPISLVYATVFGLIGFLASLPPLSADTNLRSAQISRNAIQLEKTMNPSFFNPSNSQKFVLNVQAFEGSGLFDLSHKYALKAVEWNPESYELWRILYLIKNSSASERELAVKNMKRLDPLNPDVTAR